MVFFDNFSAQSFSPVLDTYEKVHTGQVTGGGVFFAFVQGSIGRVELVFKPGCISLLKGLL